MAWGEDAAERHEMQEPTEMVRPDGSVRNAVLLPASKMDEVRRASRGIQNELQKLEIYAREQAGDYSHESCPEMRLAYRDMADRIKALLGNGS